jgi:hypothetical protein
LARGAASGQGWRRNIDSVLTPEQTTSTVLNWPRRRCERAERIEAWADMLIVDFCGDAHGDAQRNERDA